MDKQSNAIDLKQAISHLRFALQERRRNKLSWITRNATYGDKVDAYIQALEMRIAFGRHTETLEKPYQPANEEQVLKLPELNTDPDATTTHSPAGGEAPDVTDPDATGEHITGEKEEKINDSGGTRQYRPLAAENITADPDATGPHTPASGVSPALPGSAGGDNENPEMILTKPQVPLNHGSDQHHTRPAPRSAAGLVDEEYFIKLETPGPLEKVYSRETMRMACQILLNGKWEKSGESTYNWTTTITRMGDPELQGFDDSSPLYGAISQIVAAYNFAKLGGANQPMIRMTPKERNEAFFDAPYYKGSAIENYLIPEVLKPLDGPDDNDISISVPADKYQEGFLAIRMQVDMDDLRKAIRGYMHSASLHKQH